MTTASPEFMCPRLTKIGGRHGQHYSEVGNQAQESADETNEIEKRHMQYRECDGADRSQKEANQKISHHEAANHRGNQAQRDVRGVPVLQGEKHHRRGTDVMLPAQHEIHQKWHERRSQQGLRNRTEAAGQDFFPIGARTGLCFDLPRRFRGAQRFRPLPDLGNFLANGLRVVGQVLDKNYGLVRGVVHQAGHQGEQQNHGNRRGQTARQMKQNKKLHHRGQNEGQQNRHQHHRQHQLSPITKTQNGGDPNGLKRPVWLLRLGRRRGWDGRRNAGRCQSVDLGLVNGHTGIVA